MGMIHNEDTLEILPTLEPFDYVITDPPYPTGISQAMSNSKSLKDAREMTDALSQSFVGATLRAIPKKTDFAIWLMCDWRQVSFFSSIFRGMGIHSQSCIVWDKMRGTLSSNYHPSHELILFGKVGKVAEGYLGRDLISLPKPNSKGKTHPYEKPPELITQLCKSFKKGRVLDPFCGTGGLLVGAKQLGWEVEGIEISKEFCKIAQERLTQSHLFYG